MTKSDCRREVRAPYGLESSSRFTHRRGTRLRLKPHDWRRSSAMRGGVCRWPARISDVQRGPHGEGAPAGDFLA
eukprot:4431708-Pyramimonas_sp.AAC.1